MIALKTTFEIAPTDTPPRRLSEPLPKDPLGQRLCELFPYRWKPILADNPEDATQKPSWQTLTRHPLRPRALWNLWQDAAQLVGVRFGHTTCYSLIDLDIQSPYHPTHDPQSLPRIKEALASLGLYRLILVRSSWNGGLHLYIPLPEAVSTFGLAIALQQTLKAHGFALKAGHLEVFPNVKRYGKDGQFTEYNAHRLPLQPASGSILLDEDLQPLMGGLSQFVALWDTAAANQEMGELMQAIATTRQTYRSYRTNRKHSVEAWQQDLLSDIEEGWTGSGQTNELLKIIGCHGVVFLGLSDQVLADYIEQTAIGCPGYQQWCQHQHEIKQRAKEWAIACEGYYWPLGSPPNRNGSIHRHDANNIVPFNRQRSEEAQDRIRQAMEELRERGELPAGITARMKAIASAAQCSFATLRKYPGLWHPEKCVIEENTGHPADGTASTQEITQPLECPSQAELHTSLYMKGGATSEGFLAPEENSLPLGEGLGRGNASFPQPLPAATILELPLHPVNLCSVEASKEPSMGSAIAPGQESNHSCSIRQTSGVWEAIADMSDIIAAIQVQIRQLGWSVEQVYRFIAEQFGGKRRSQLTDDELIVLLYRLVEQEL